MNYAGTFGTDYLNDAPVSLTDHHIKMDSVGTSPPGPIAHETIIVPDAQLLFSGDFNRLGNDLMLSRDGHEFLVTDYFRGEKRAFLASPDGANLSGDVVQALTGHVQYAQAGGAQSAPKDIGQVSKLVGTATVIRNGVLVELHSGDRVYKGDVAQAGANSACTIVFIDGSVFGLSANARMVLNDMVYDQAGTSNSALISLVRGTISFVAGETAKHGDMKVETPVATMGIRGTAVLVEIGFDIPADGKGPPVNFQVLVEPDGTTGSYIIYSKSDPSVILGTIDKAGQVYSVSGNGTFSNLPSPEMSQLAASIIQQVFTQRFQGYVPDKPVPPPQAGSGGGAGSTPATPPDTTPPKFPSAPGDTPVIIPITIQVPDGNGGTKTVTIPVGVGVADVAPTITHATFSIPKSGTMLLTPSNINVVDPDNTSFTFIATATHGTFQLNISGNWVTTTTFTSADVAVGHVRFVSDGTGSMPTISLVANDGQLKSTAIGVSVSIAVDAPFHLVEAGAHGRGHSFSIDHLSIGDASYDTQALATNHWVDNHNGTWSLAETYGIVILNTSNNTLTYLLNNYAADPLTSSNHPSETVSVYLLTGAGHNIPSQINVDFTIDGKNDAPVAHNDTAHIQAGQTSVASTNNLLANDTDVDTAHGSLTISAVAFSSSHNGSFVVEGKYGQLVVDANGAYTYKLGVTHDQSIALAHLHPGQDAADTFYYKATDGSADSNLAKLTVSFDKPYDQNPPDAHGDHLIISGGAFENGPHGLKSVTFDNSALLGNDKDNDIHHNKLYVDDYDNNFSYGHANSSFDGEDTVYTIANSQLPGAGKTVHDSFNYTAIDQLGSSSDSAHVDVTIVGADIPHNPWTPQTYTLTSTHDNDVLIGGDTSKENFVFKPGMGQDTIIDFKSGQDKIILSGFDDIPTSSHAFDYWLDHHTSTTIVSGKVSTVIDIDGPSDLGPHEKITVVGVTPQHLHASDFIIHPGYA